MTTTASTTGTTAAWAATAATRVACATSSSATTLPSRPVKKDRQRGIRARTGDATLIYRAGAHGASAPWCPAEIGALVDAALAAAALAAGSLGRSPGSRASEPASGPWLAADRAGPGSRDQVGPGPALLGADLPAADHRCHRRLAGLNAGNQRLRRHGSSPHNLRCRAPRAAEHAGPFRWRHGGVAGDPGAEHVQAAGHDPLRPAAAAEGAHPARPAAPGACAMRCSDARSLS
jgi:hypothetical protein